jgi:hypothetical protein
MDNSKRVISGRSKDTADRIVSSCSDCKRPPATGGIEVTGRSPGGRERRVTIALPGPLSADGARRVAVRLLEAARRVEQA